MPGIAATVELDERLAGGEVLLHFGAVDYWCQVFVNGQTGRPARRRLYPLHLAGSRQYVQPGANEIAVRVY